MTEFLGWLPTPDTGGFFFLVIGFYVVLWIGVPELLDRLRERPSPIGGRLDAYKVSQLNDEEEIGGTD